MKGKEEAVNGNEGTLKVNGKALYILQDQG